MAENIELLTAHHLAYRVVNIIEDAKEFVVLVTAYLTSWTHLEHAIKSAIARGVHVSLVLRAPDGAKRDREKREEQGKALQALGVRVHYLERLHAKAYLNEKEAIVTSYNLVAGSNDAIELGVLIQDPGLVRDCLAKVRAYCPDLDSRDATPAREQKPAALPAHDRGFCIGCSEPVPFDAARPMCLSCYRSSRKGANANALTRRGCHRCGKSGPSTLSKPICPACWLQLTKDQQASITSALA